MKKRPHTRHEEKAGVKEQELIEAFGQMVREDYPNPERVNCPTEEVLKHTAASPSTGLRSVLDHIAKCAPCLEEYDRLRRNVKTGTASTGTE